MKRFPQMPRHIANAIGAGLFAALFINFIVQIAARFVFDKPMSWTDELAVVLNIWMVLWCAAFVVREREHVRFDLAYNAVSPKLQRIMRMAAACFLIGLMGYALYGNWDYIVFMGREKTPVLGISFFWVFLPFMFLLVSLVISNAWSLVREFLPNSKLHRANHSEHPL